jgi:hypothetical protein
MNSNSFIKNFNIPELIDKIDCKTPPPQIAELAVLVTAENKSDQLAALIERAQKLHKTDGMQPIFAITGDDIPQIIEQRLQVQEKEFMKSTLLDYWYQPLRLTSDFTALTPKSIYDKLLKMVTRYSKINAVIAAACRANSVKYNSKDGKEVYYYNIKSDWYDDDGMKWQGLSVNYGRATKQREQELMIKIGKLYTRMGYAVKTEERLIENSKVLRPDLVLEKDGKQWFIELKVSKVNEEYTDALNRMIVNYELWTKYLSEYQPLKIDL